jgi:hypothetical protein
MSIPNLLDGLLRKRSRSPRRGGPAAAGARPHLRFEVLEDRLTPAGILNLFNTGVSAAGVPLTAGIDPHYTVISNGANNPSFDGPAVIQSTKSSTSANVEPPGTNPGPGTQITTFDYQTTFTLAPGYNPATVTLAGTTAADDTLIDIMVNGVSTGDRTGAFTLTSGFQTGTNTLTFVVQNSAAPATGFDAEFTTATAQPLAPTLASISPAAGTVGAGATTITLTGNNFLSNSTTVDFNGTPLATTVNSLTSMTATIPAADLTAAGTASITAVTAGPGGGTSAAQTFAIDNAPTLTSVSPAAVAAGAASTTITLIGTNFVSGSTVDLTNNYTNPPLATVTPLTTTFVSSTELTAVIPAADLTAGGNNSISVVNTGQAGGTTNALPFAVNNPTPTLTGVTPDTAAVGYPDTIVTLTGTNFVSGSTVEISGPGLTAPGIVLAGGGSVAGAPLATTYVSPTELTATVPEGLTAAGDYSLFVYTAGPGGGVSASQTFAVSNPVPTLTSVSPGSTALGYPDTIVTLTGTNFVAGSTVAFNGATNSASGSTAELNGVALPTTFVSATELTAAIPAADLTAAGTDSITVVNAGPGGGTSAAVAFSVTAGYLNPAQGNQSAAFAGLSAQQAFVQSLYVSALGRAGSVAELNGYLPILNGPNGQTVVAEAVENSSEGRDNLVKGWYQTYLGRAANGGEEQGFVSALVAGASEATVLSELLGSSEFFARAQTLASGGTPQQNFVHALYLTLLDRTPSSAEVASQAAGLTAGQTPTAVALSFLQSREFRSDLVQLYYSTLLHRTAAPGEINYWVNYSQLDSYGIRIAIESSPEFYADA